MRFRGQRLLLFEYCTPASTFSVHKQQLSEPARHRRAAVLIVTQAHLFLSVILLTSTAFMSRKRKRENYCMLRSEGKIIACSNKKKAHVGNRTRTHAGIHERLDPIFTRGKARAAHQAHFVLNSYTQFIHLHNCYTHSLC